MTTYSRESFVFHADTEPGGPIKTERKLDQVRLPWSPTPLNPYKFSRDGQPYMMASLDTIDRIMESTSELELANNAPFHIKQLMPSSVRGALTRRFHAATLKVPTGDTPLELFKKAENGSASPVELIALLELDPSMSSVEVAKYSHPYEWDVTEQMDKTVTDALDKFDFTVNNDQPVRYIFAGADNMQDPSAVTIVRKVDIGTIDSVNGTLNVVKRDSYLLDLAADFDGAADVRKECKRFISGVNRNNPDGFDGAPARYNKDFLPVVLDEGIDSYADYVYPAVSSYYLHV